MRESLGRHHHTAQHSGDFIDPLLWVENLDFGSRLRIHGGFRNLEVLMPESRHLREMRHGQHLNGVAELPELLPDDFSNPPTNATIDLIEDQRRNTFPTRQRHLKGQTDSRKLATRCHLGQRAKRHSRIGTHLDLDLISSMGPGNGIIIPLNLKDDPRLGHPQLSNQRHDILLKSGSSLATSLGKHVTEVTVLPLQSQNVCLELLTRLTRADQRRLLDAKGL